MCAGDARSLAEFLASVFGEPVDTVDVSSRSTEALVPSIDAETTDGTPPTWVDVIESPLPSCGLAVGAEVGGGAAESSATAGPVSVFVALPSVGAEPWVGTGTDESVALPTSFGSAAGVPGAVGALVEWSDGPFSSTFDDGFEPASALVGEVVASVVVPVVDGDENPEVELALGLCDPPPEASPLDDDDVFDEPFEVADAPEAFPSGPLVPPLADPPPADDEVPDDPSGGDAVATPWPVATATPSPSATASAPVLGMATTGFMANSISCPAAIQVRV